MTRINVLPPERLTDQHLIAEYRELPRIFALARPLRPGEGARYTLGAGHVVFFYDKLAFLAERQAALISECQRRGFNVAHTAPPVASGPLAGTWAPTPEAVAENLGRLREKLAARPGFYRYMGKPAPAAFY